jgi:hypothetical protein
MTTTITTAARRITREINSAASRPRRLWLLFDADGRLVAERGYPEWVQDEPPLEYAYAVPAAGQGKRVTGREAQDAMDLGDWGRYADPGIAANIAAAYDALDGPL